MPERSAIDLGFTINVVLIIKASMRILIKATNPLLTSPRCCGELSNGHSSLRPSCPSQTRIFALQSRPLSRPHFAGRTLSQTCSSYMLTSTLSSQTCLISSQVPWGGKFVTINPNGIRAFLLQNPDNHIPLVRLKDLLIGGGVAHLVDGHLHLLRRLSRLNHGSEGGVVGHNVPPFLFVVFAEN